MYAAFLLPIHAIMETLMTVLWHNHRRSLKCVQSAEGSGTGATTAMCNKRSLSNVQNHLTSRHNLVTSSVPKLNLAVLTTEEDAAITAAIRAVAVASEAVIPAAAVEAAVLAEDADNMAD
jgi:hypothetical protein